MGCWRILKTSREVADPVHQWGRRTHQDQFSAHKGHRAQWGGHTSNPIFSLKVAGPLKGVQMNTSQKLSFVSVRLKGLKGLAKHLTPHHLPCPYPKAKCLA